jgi:hypothetical protein
MVTAVELWKFPILNQNRFNLLFGSLIGPVLQELLVQCLTHSFEGWWKIEQPVLHPRKSPGFPKLLSSCVICLSAALA